MINPYTFVPLRQVVRGTPQGHSRLQPQNLSGSLTYTLTAISPLYLKDAEGAVPTNVEQEVVIYGSSMKGAVRNLHEALTSSCLRVLDLDYRPVHRSPVLSTAREGWELAVVAAVENKLPTAVRLCSEKCLVPFTGPKKDLEARLWRTGDRFDVATKQGTRERVPDGRVTYSPDGAFHLLVTATDARPTKASSARANPPQVHFIAGKPGPEITAVAREALEDLALALETSPEGGMCEKEFEQAGRPEFVDVAWPAGSSHIIAKRRHLYNGLRVGDPLWVRRSGDTVTQIRLSRAWRDVYDGRMPDRIQNAAPCTEPAELCPSCQLFGSAGHDDDLEAQQNSYAGHVRFCDVVAEDVSTVTQSLAPLGSPKPTAGQFYLVNTNFEGQQNDPPLAHWGAVHGRAEPRDIRGRKFYWATSRTERSKKSDQHSERAGAKENATLIEAGSTFTGRLTFDNLTPGQLGLLLAALAPGQVYGDDRLVQRVGGGKPFGFGAVRVTFDWDDLRLDSAESRYLPETSPPKAGPHLVQPPPLPDDVRPAITLDHVQDAQIAYPGTIDPSTGAVDLSYFVLTNGLQTNNDTSGAGGPLRSLPHITAQDQNLPRPRGAQQR